MQCNSCGADNRDDARFCRKCGSPLNHKPARFGRASRIILAVVVCLLLGSIALLAMPSLIKNGANDSQSLKDAPEDQKRGEAGGTSNDSTNNTKGSDSDRNELEGKGIEENVPNAERAGLGSLNKTAAFDGDYIYFAVEVNEQGEGLIAPAIVRIKKGDDGSAEVIWEGTPTTAKTIPLPPTIKASSNGLLVLVPGDDWGSTTGLRAYAVKPNGSEAKELDFGRSVELATFGDSFQMNGDKVFYATASKSGDKAYWEVRSCGIDGSSDSVVAKGESKDVGAYGSPISVLGIDDGKVFFAIEHQSSNGDSRSWTEVLSVPADGGTASSVLKTSGFGSFGNVCVASGRLFTAEGNELVSYDLVGGDRRKCAEVEGKEHVYIWNMTGSAAYVHDGRAAYRVDLATGAVEPTSILIPDGGYPSLELVKEEAFVTGSTISRVAPTSEGPIYIWPGDGGTARHSDGEASSPVDSVGAIEASSGDAVQWSSTADYDGDGSLETFAIVAGESDGTSSANGSDVWASPSLWYCSSTGVSEKVTSFRGFTHVNDVFEDPDGSGYTLLSVETTAGGSGSTSHVFGVRGGSPVSIPAGGRCVQESNGDIVMAKEYWKDGGGHMLEWFGMTFDPSTFELIEGSSLGITNLYESPDILAAH